EAGYGFGNMGTIIREYNDWYTINNPGQVPFVMPYLYALPTKQLDDFGYYLFKSLKDQNSDLIVGLMFTQEEIVETIESQKIDQSIKDEELSNIPSNYNQDVLKENMKSFNNLLQNTSFINWS